MRPDLKSDKYTKTALSAIYPRITDRYCVLAGPDTMIVEDNGAISTGAHLNLCRMVMGVIPVENDWIL